MKVPVVKPLSKVNADRKAIQFLELIFPEGLKDPQPFPALKFFELGKFRKLFKYECYVDALPEKHQGFTDFDAQEIVISESTYEGAQDNYPRDLFTIMHEFAHAIIHGPQLQNKQMSLIERRGVTMAHRKSIPAYLDPEWQANSFAGGVAAPIMHVNRLLKEGVTVAELTAIFKISPQTAEIRVERVFEYRENGVLK